MKLLLVGHQLSISVSEDISCAFNGRALPSVCGEYLRALLAACDVWRGQRAFVQQLTKMQSIPDTGVLLGGMKCLVVALSPKYMESPFKFLSYVYIFQVAFQKDRNVSFPHIPSFTLPISTSHIIFLLLFLL